MVSCVAVYMALKLSSDSPYDVINASLTTAVIPYPCCEAGTAVWLTSVIGLA